MEAFLTGSRAYGNPSADSDIDLVIRGSTAILDWLAAATDRITDEEHYVERHYRFGRLDLIVCCSDAEFEAWRAGTESLIAKKPQTREQAVEEIKSRLDLICEIRNS